MRILFVSPLPSPLARSLAELGHDVVIVPPRARRCARAMMTRPAAAYVAAISGRVTALLTAMRVPYVVEIARGDAGAKAMAIARGARSVVAPTEELARFAVDALGAREASIVAPGIELAIADVDREEAKRRLQLQAGLRIVTMVSRLDQDLPLEMLAEAHRKMAGVALLIVGDGDRADFVQAMRATTRPSSPVIFLGSRSPEEEVLAIQAAHACVSLRRPRADVAMIGRRQVALQADERIVAGVEIADAAGLRAALEGAIEAPRIDRATVERARHELSWAHAAEQVAQLLEDIA